MQQMPKGETMTKVKLKRKQTKGGNGDTYYNQFGTKRSCI